MNETNTPAVVDEKPSAEAPTQAPPPKRSGSSALALVVAVLALIVAIALGVAAYFIWYQVQQQASEQANIKQGIGSRLDPVRASVGDMERKLGRESEALDKRIDSLEQDERALANRVSMLAALVGRSETGWAVAEVEYLLRVANQRLQMQRDKATALQALKAADARLRDLADPHYQGVREQIAEEINAIDAVPNVDVSGLSATLDAALKLVDRLPIEGSHYRPQTGTAAVEPAEQTSMGRLQDLGKVVWSSLSGLFRVREHDKPVGPMLAPKREYFLRENLRLQLAAARLALLREDPAQFRAALDTAVGWLQRYFDPKAAGVREQIEKLQAIAGTDIRPALPDVSASLRLLRQQLQLSMPQTAMPADAAIGVADEPSGDTP